MGKIDTCRECGHPVRTKRASAFCSAKCRATYHNRRACRGADLYDLVMGLRFDRVGAEAAGVWSLMCRMAASFRAEDERARAGRQSWDDVEKVKARNVHLLATVVADNVVGLRRRGRGT
jgi:hypothetical protein